MIVNLRELGGYGGLDGKKVKEGMLFRSGHLSFPDEDLSGYLEPLALSLVFDLRSADETRQEPYTLPDGIEYRHRPVVTSMEGEMRALNMAFPFPNQKEDDEDFTPLSVPPDVVSNFGGLLTRLYSDMGENPAIFGGIIREMLENGEKPVLFHCSAGKDRTGVLAGHRPRRHRRAARELQHLTRGITDPHLLTMIRDMLVVKDEYLEAAFRHVRAYPRFEDYARERLNLDSHDLSALRQRYLE